MESLGKRPLGALETGAAPGPARPVHPGDGGAAFELHYRAHRHRGNTAPIPHPDHGPAPRGLVSHQAGGLNGEQLADLLGDDGDDLGVFALPRDERRDAAERRLLSEQASQLHLGSLGVGYVACRGVDQPDVVIRGCGPLKPAVAAVTMAPSILEGKGLAAGDDRRVLGLRRLEIVRVHKAHEGVAQQLFSRMTEQALARGVHTRDTAAEVGHAQHVERQREEALELLAGTRSTGWRVALAGAMIGGGRSQALTSAGTPTGRLSATPESNGAPRVRPRRAVAPERQQ